MTTSMRSLSLSLFFPLSLSFLHSLKILSFWDRKSVIGLKNHLQQHYQRAHTIKTLIQHWGINILVRPRRVLSVLCACVCVCVSSCMSILSCPGVLSGSRAAWSREITLGIMGAAGWGWGGGEMTLSCWSDARRLLRNPSLFPTQDPTSASADHSRPRPLPGAASTPSHAVGLTDVAWGGNAADVVGTVATDVKISLTKPRTTTCKSHRVRQRK